MIDRSTRTGASMTLSLADNPPPTTPSPEPPRDPDDLHAVP